MPRAKDYCGRMPGHQAECRTAAALADRRERLTERRRGQTLVTPETRSRWNQTLLPSQRAFQVLRQVRARPTVPDMQYRPRIHRDVLQTGDGLPRTAEKH